MNWNLGPGHTVPALQCRGSGALKASVCALDVIDAKSNGHLQRMWPALMSLLR